VKLYYVLYKDDVGSIRCYACEHNSRKDFIDYLNGTNYRNNLKNYYYMEVPKSCVKKIIGTHAMSDLLRGRVVNWPLQWPQ
jgi:hypothetical protein